MSMSVFVDLIIRKANESGAYNELGEIALRATIKKALDDKYDSLIQSLNMRMALDAENCTYNSAFYEKELKTINREIREYVSELARVNND